MKSRGVKFWSKNLEEEREKVKRIKKIALETGKSDDYRHDKHAKNRHIKNIEKHQKETIKNNMAKANLRWRTMKEIIPEKDKTPTEIRHNNKIITSAKEIADEYSEYLDKN